MYRKKDCERYTDSAKIGTKYHFSKSRRIDHNGISLYKFPESRNRNYRREYRIKMGLPIRPVGWPNKKKESV